MNKQIQLHFFGKYILLFFTVIISVPCFSQTKPGTTFSGTNSKDPNVCAASSGNFMSEKQVDDLITDMLSKIGTKNRYIVVNCTQVENCQAFLYNGKPYILYNPNFLGKVKKLNFSSATLPSVSEKDWETLTILAHELGHHVNNHLLNPLPDATQHEMELEADETAGFIIYLLGGKLTQAQQAYNNIPERGSYTHPGKQKRMDAIAKGWDDAKLKYPRYIPSPGGGDKPVVPVIKNEANTVTDKDGNVYKTVKIDNQIWMQSNLNVSHFSNGDLIPEVKSAAQWEKAGDLGNPAWCYYENNSGNGKVYGKLYNWYAVNDPRGLAPKGWHIPSDVEWNRLTDYLGGKDVAGGKLKANIRWKSPNTGATNSVGFAGLPGGFRAYNGTFINVGQEGNLWSASEAGATTAWYRSLNCTSADAATYGYGRALGFSVRCVRD